MLVLGLLPSTSLLAAPWSFGEAVDVTTASSERVFHHIDSSGRKNVAATDAGVAVAWEDDRDGTPRVYLAYKGLGEAGFERELRVSQQGEAYEPSLVALDGERFAVAWEEEGAIWLRLVSLADKPELGPPRRISHRQGAQATLASDGRRLIVVWSEREQRFGRVWVRLLDVDGLESLARADCPVDAIPPADEQLYPAATLLSGRLVVAWEDRRPKHTIIMAAKELSPGSCEFSKAIRISEKPKGRNLPYGAGHGVSRVAIDRVAETRAFAAWADKREFRNGYDIWGAFHQDSEILFGTNERVQDDFGGLSKQRHATVAGHVDGTLVVAWDDEREGNADLMLSWREGDAWSDDWPVPVASGQGQQSSPSMAIDPMGNLHLVWIERDAIGGVTRLKYGFGEIADE
jgi:hypothetical protein